MKFFLFVILCVLIACPPELKAAPEAPEKFVFHIYWIGIKAGMAAMHFENTIDGVAIESRAQSASFISIFYRVDDLARSTLYSDGYPHTYILKIEEGRHRRDKSVMFGVKPDHEPQKVIYENKLDGETAEFYLDKQAFDPLSAFYEIRKRYLEVGRSEYLDIFDNKKLFNVEVQVLRKERVHVPAGEFNTIVIKPVMKSEGIFMKKGDMLIWLTDDEKKIPVKIESKIKIGSFVAKLVEGKY